MKIQKPSLTGKRGILLKNTFMLYILQFSTSLLGLVVAPFETRVLGKEIFGYLGASAAIMAYFQLVIDFGFLLSATEEVSRSRHDNRALRGIFTSVTLCKLGLTLASFVVLVALCQMIPAWKQKETLLLLTFWATALSSWMPDYLYRGLERMTAVTVRTVAIRVFFTTSIFIFLRGPEDICVVPVLNIVGNGIALVCAYFHLKKSFHITFRPVTRRETWRVFRRSSTFFYSRIATTAYTALNTVILDIISASGAVTSYYTSANNLITAGKNCLSPISDSMYPYMARNRDFKLVKRVLLIAEPVIFLFCAIVFVWAEPLCAWYFGAEFAPTGQVLRTMLPVGVIILPSYILGFPTLTAMGLSQYANYSVIAGSVFHVCLLAILSALGLLNMVTLGLSVSVTECVILLYRVVVIVKNRRLMRATGED